MHTFQSKAQYLVAFTSELALDFNKSYRKIIWLSWNCVSTIPQVRTLTLRTSISVGTYLGAMIRFMFSKKLKEQKAENIMYRKV